MTELSKRSSDVLKIANFIAIVLVVAIHYNSKRYIDLSQGLSINYYFQDWFTNSLARIAVPFFGFAAGFFYFLNFRKIGEYWLQLSKRLWSLIVPYAIAVSIVFFHDMTLNFYQHEVLAFSLPLFAYHFLHPDSVQFWFLRDLIILVLFFCPILHFSINRFPRLVLTFLLFAWLIEFQFFPLLAGWYFVNVEILFFFSVGCFFGKNLNSFNQLLDWVEDHAILISLTFIIFSISRVILSPYFSVWYGVHGGGMGTLLLYKLTIIAGLPTLYIASAPFRNNKLLVWLSTFSFFIFLYHIKPVATISMNIASLFLPDAFLFYLTFPLSIGISILCGWFLKRTLPTIYGYVTGGR